MRREWIEMERRCIRWECCLRSPSMRREWIEISISRSDLPLKRSPSMRREWIEI